jgi:iron complex outermembrane receptor protein
MSNTEHRSKMKAASTRAVEPIGEPGREAARLLTARRRAPGKIWLHCGAACSALMFAGAAVAAPASADKTAAIETIAQTAETGGAGANKTTTLNEVVVTGTLLRGVAPTGTNVLGVTPQDVQVSGAATAIQLLQTIPQSASFNTLQSPPGGFNTATSNRPNLRNLPGASTSGSASTLVLLDGHRLVGMGVTSTSPDPDVIPPGIIERVEVVPDGGSAIYGSDAVGGVINFITRKNFNGFDADARYGFGDNGYRTFDANATFGRSWDSGSAYLSYNYAKNDPIFGRDRDYVKTYPQTVAGIPFPVTSLFCSPGNVQNLLAGGTNYALPFTTGTAVANTANQCDLSGDVTIYPRQERNTVFAGLSQDLTSSLKLDVRAFYTRRTLFSSLGVNNPQSPVFVSSIPGISGLTFSPFVRSHFVNPSDSFEIQELSFQWGPPEGSQQHVYMKTWGIAPTLTADLGHGWQARGLLNYGESRTESHTSQFNTTGLTNAIAAGEFNPYDPASSTAAGLEAASNFETYGLARQFLFNPRIIADGDLFNLPGGAVKLAVGAEYAKQGFDSQTGAIVPGTQNTGYAGLFSGSTVLIPAAAPLPVAKLRRDVESVFGELSVPIIGASNRMTGAEELTLSVSGRFDHYSDFGSTTNPKIGVTYKPLEWVKVRGSWGKSFVAPSLADSNLATTTSITYLANPPSIFLPPANLVANGTYPAIKPGQSIAVLLGNVPGIAPQKAKTYSIGVDVEPPMIDRLKLSLTYWKIDYTGIIGIPNFTNQSLFWGSFGSFIDVNPTTAQINAINSLVNVTNGVPCAPQPTCLYAILDARKTNLGIYKPDGLDFAINYSYPTGFGALDFNLSGSYTLHIDQAAVSTLPLVDSSVTDTSRFRMRADLGAQISALRADLVVNYNSGYDLGSPVGLAPQQTSVSGFTTVDLFGRYDFPGEGMSKDLSLTLNVSNLFDVSPPVFRTQSIVLSTSGFANGGTAGRLVQLGVSKKF